MKQANIFVFSAVLAFGLVAGAFVFAQEANINFPIAELGNCGSKEECHTYCDDPDNRAACVDFAERNGLMSRQEAERALRSPQISLPEEGGPGGCKSEQECKTYCDDVRNIEACLAFAEEHGMIDDAELAEARKVAKVLREGGSLPGGCTSKESCEAYCNDDANVLECVEFAEKAGFMSSEEAAMVRKTGGRGPGGCRGQECETFCQDPNNMEVCMDFAVEHGMMSAEEAARAKQMMTEGNFDPRMGPGPGGPGMMPGGSPGHEFPPEVKACLEQELGADGMRQLMELRGEPSQELGERMSRCFGDMGPPEGDHPDFDRPEPGFGPGPEGMMMPPDGMRPEDMRMPPGMVPGEFDREAMEARAREGCEQYGGTWTGASCDGPRPEDFNGAEFDHYGPPPPGSFEQHEDFDQQYPEEEYREPAPEQTNDGFSGLLMVLLAPWVR